MVRPNPVDAGIQRLQRWGFTLEGWHDNRRGEWWLLAQLLLILAHLLPGFPSPGSFGIIWPGSLRILGISMVLAGLLLSLISFRALGASLSPLPEPMPGAPLMTEGLYARCRHPLYLSVLVCSLGVCIALGSLLHGGLLLGLVGVLGAKARREEHRLLDLHPDYGAYRATTLAIVPGLPWLDWRTLNEDLR